MRQLLHISRLEIYALWPMIINLQWINIQKFNQTRSTANQIPTPHSPRIIPNQWAKPSPICIFVSLFEVPSRLGTYVATRRDSWLLLLWSPTTTIDQAKCSECSGNTYSITNPPIPTRPVWLQVPMDDKYLLEWSISEKLCPPFRQ